MTTREELARLINPDAEAKHERQQNQGFVSEWYQAKDAAIRVVDAGWRPPVSGDVIGAARRVIQNETGECRCDPMYSERVRVDPECVWCNHGLGLAELLADAGLLARSPQQLDRAVHEYHGTYPRLEDAQDTEPYPLEMVDAHVSVDGSSEGIVGDLAVSDVGEWISIPVPPDDETVERVATP